MVFGIILYEAFDIAYNLGRIVVGGGRYLYQWYYAIDDTTTNERIEMLMRRIEVLEKNMLLEDNQEDQNMNSN
jgi:hypothetical protein